VLKYPRTIRDYPSSASFLLEYDNTVHGHIPENDFQDSHTKNFNKFLHANIPQQSRDLIFLQLLEEAILSLNLAKLIPVLKFRNDEWCTEIIIYKKNALCAM